VFERLAGDCDQSCRQGLAAPRLVEPHHILLVGEARQHSPRGSRLDLQRSRKLRCRQRPERQKFQRARYALQVSIG
jgi:hypothetical protein